MDTFDGRNPAPPGMYKTHVNNGINYHTNSCRISSINSIDNSLVPNTKTANLIHSAPTNICNHWSPCKEGQNNNICNIYSFTTHVFFINSYLVGGWTNPFENIWSSTMGSSFPIIGGETQTNLSCHHLDIHSKTQATQKCHPNMHQF